MNPTSFRTHAWPLVLAGCLAMASAAPAGTGDDDSAAEVQPEPVTGAFGILLGQQFEPALVKRVIGQEQKNYRGPGGRELEGTLYLVEPRLPDERFGTYSVATTVDGTVYAIRAEYAAADGSSRCDVTRELAATLERRHGRPRGRGARGEWYAFRDDSVEHYRGIRLYSNRCRRGIYEIVYSDDGVRQEQ